MLQNLCLRIWLILLKAINTNASEGVYAIRAHSACWSNSTWLMYNKLTNLHQLISFLKIAIFNFQPNYSVPNWCIKCDWHNDMLLLPDQTYEQCQHVLTPLIALRRLLSDADYRPTITFEPNGKPATAHRTFVEQSIGRSDCGSTTTQSDGSDDHKVRADSPASYEQTSEFFNNIPDFNGEPLGPFSIPQTRDNVKTTADLLKECEQFLYKYRIRPDFFCRYRKAMEWVI